MIIWLKKMCASSHLLMQKEYSNKGGCILQISSIILHFVSKYVKIGYFGPL